ncbi:MAG: carboxypeptidase-like regulatory domain-containing protein [Bryobacteraceae bacterium]
MRHLSFSWWRAVCLIWLACFVASADGQIFTPLSNSGPNAPSQKKVRLTGAVVNAVTGEGVSKAKVDIAGGQVVSVFTGPDGHFEMDNVPEGQWQVTARKPGYFSDQELARGFFRPKVFRVTENTSDITVKLTPAATINGHVVDDQGEPVESAQIEVIAGAIENGRRTWQQRGGAQTDDSGEYNISSLIPGDYYVRVKPVAETVARTPGQGYDEVYAGCYYPGAPTQDQAAVLHVAGGQQAQADFTLARARGYRISGQVATQGNFVQVVAIRGEEVAASAGVSQNGRFRLSGLTPGQYSIMASRQDQNQPLFGEELVSISQADLTNVQILMQQPQSIPVQIQVVKTKDETGTPHMSQFSSLGVYNGIGSGPQANGGPSVPVGNIQLTPTRQTGFGMNYAQANPNGLGPGEQLAVKGALPGTYRVAVQAFQPFYIESIRSGSVDLLDQPLTITSGGAVAPIQITLRDDSANLTVKIMQDGQPANGGAVLVIPTAHPSETEYPRLWEGGNVLPVGALAPGDYRIYAFDSIDNLEYANPEVLRAFAEQSQQVTLEPNGQTTVTLELIELSKQRSTP